MKKCKILLGFLLISVGINVSAQVCKVLIVRQHSFMFEKDDLKADKETGILHFDGDTCIVSHEAITTEGFGLYINKNAASIYSIVFENPGKVIDFLPWGAFINLEYLNIFGNDFDHMENLPEGVYSLEKLNTLKLNQIYSFDMAGFTAKVGKLKGLKYFNYNEYAFKDHQMTDLEYLKLMRACPGLTVNGKKPQVKSNEGYEY